MKYTRFEDLPVWKASQDLAVGVYELVAGPAFGAQGDLRSQLQRSSLSVSNNIAEGFERGTTNELLTFIYIARGSAGETRSGLRFAARLAERGVLRRECQKRIAELVSGWESVSRQLRGWADSLQNGEIAGPRYLTDQSRAEYGQAKRAGQFMEKLQRIREGRQENGGDLKTEI
jgi:four helix bundle protein